MRLSELILRKLSRSTESKEFDEKFAPLNKGGELSLLRKEYPNFSELVSGKQVIDYGCGVGKQSLSLFEEEGCYVCGVDTNEQTLSKAINNAKNKGVDEQHVMFIKSVPSNLKGTFDVVISQNAMEHFPEPVSVLLEMKQLIKENGKLIITFGPPWYAPYGSHMYYFCKMPWINILFSEKTVMNVRGEYRNDGAKRYVDVESGLNMMTVKKFENIVNECGLVFEFRKYSCVKGQNWLSTIPFLRELFINHVSCILKDQQHDKKQ